MALIGKITKDGVYLRPGDPGFDGPMEKGNALSISEKKPHRSKNMAVHAEQVESFNQQLRTNGDHTSYYEKGTGDFISTSAYARQREAIRRGKRFN